MVAKRGADQPENWPGLIVFQKKNGPLLGSESQARVKALKLNRHENNPRSILTILQ